MCVCVCVCVCLFDFLFDCFLSSVLNIQRNRCLTDNCCLSVVLLLDKGDYPENSHAVFCNKYRSFEPFMCLDLVKEALTKYICQGTNQNPVGFLILPVEIKTEISFGRNQNLRCLPVEF